jgi:enolase
MMNIMNGGAHANNNIDFQEFMVVPIGAENEREAVRMGSEVYSALKKKLSSLGLSVAVGDEGGFAPMLSGEREAIELILDSVKAAGYKAGDDIALALDMASSEWYRQECGDYYLPKSKRTLGRDDLCALITSLCRDYPIISVEDGMAEDDVEGWRLLTENEGKQRLLVGDDLFVTNKDRLESGIKNGIANAILIKPNQIGTLTEVAEAVALAKANGYKTIMSHRSGETADSFISDLAVGLGTELIKAGAPARSERTEKYNRLMRIENELFNPIFAKDFL